MTIETLPHLGGHCWVTHTDAPVLDAIIEVFGPFDELLDIGCGPCGMRPLAEVRGMVFIGIDGDPNVPATFIHDYSQGRSPIQPTKARRLGWSVEFVEHVEDQFKENFLADFATCDVLFMSHAVPDEEGLKGHHHVNCQWSDFWIGELDRAGFAYDAHMTGKCITVATDQYTRATGMVFIRRKRPCL